MRGLALLLLLSSFSAFAQDCSLAGSVIKLSSDIDKADQKIKMKELRDWYKEKVTKEEAESPYFESRSVYNFPLDCENPNKYGEEPICKGHAIVNRNVLPLKAGDKKSKNPYLAQVFSKKDGKIDRVDLESYGMGGQVFVVHKTLKDGSKVHYKINTNLSANFNPVEVIDEKKGQIETSRLSSLMGFNMGFNNGIGW